jgi:hypothetical protein
MKKDTLKKIIAGLGVTGMVGLGAITATLPEPSIETPRPPETVCEGEEFEIGKTKVCMTQENYGIMKANLKSHYDDDKIMNPAYFRPYMEVIDNELDKQNKKSYTDVKSKQDLMGRLNQSLQ